MLTANNTFPSLRGAFPTAIAPCLLLLLLVSLSPAQAIKELVIGRGGIPWTDIEDSSSFALRQADSLWIWGTEPDQNLGPALQTRGGQVWATGLTGDEGNQRLVFLNVPEAAALMDGDPDTAFNPDELGLPRDTELFIDLGGSFTVKQVRIYPRLDAAHRQLFPQAFELAFNPGAEPLRNQNAILGLSYQSLVRFSTQLTFTSDQTRLARNTRTIVEWPGLRQITGTRQARYLRFTPLEDSPWEIAEIEIITDGSAPEALFVSTPLLASSGSPIWGQVRTDAGDLAQMPVILQTRTGPDSEPLHFFILISQDREIRVAKGAWQLIDQLGGGLLGATRQGPIRPNPAWSDWTTVTDGIVRSPGPNQYIQFRARLLRSGTALPNLIFEFNNRPLGTLEAELWPTSAAPGVETPFSLLMSVGQVNTPQRTDTGFRFIEIQTPAQITAVDSVRIDERPIVHTVQINPGEGFRINLWERITRDGTLVEIFFRSRVFVDGTGFQVRAIDERPAGDRTETAYQFATEADIDPLTLGASLTVRLDAARIPLIGRFESLTAAFTPNGDGVNDRLELAYNLLKLTRPAPVFFEIFDLSGRPVRRGLSQDASGRFARIWDGRDPSGRLVPPGLYLFNLRVEADDGTSVRQGVVNLAY